MSGPVPLCVSVPDPQERNLEVTFVMEAEGHSETIGSVTGEPWLCYWNTSSVEDGYYTIIAEVREAGSSTLLSSTSHSLVVSTYGNQGVWVSREWDLVEGQPSVVAAYAADSVPLMQFWRIDGRQATLMGDNPYHWHWQPGRWTYRLKQDIVVAGTELHVQAVAVDPTSHTAAYSYVQLLPIVSPDALRGPVGELASRANGAHVYVRAAAVVAESATDGALYVEDVLRAGGIRVVDVGNNYSGGEGRLVAVEGILWQAPDLVLEREVVATTIWDLGPAQPEEIPGALTMPLRNLGGTPPSGAPGVDGGAGLYNVGLLVKVSGLVTAIEDGAFFIDDDTSAGAVKVACDCTVPDLGSLVMVKGISSIWEDGGGVRLRLIRARGSDDIAVIAGGGGLQSVSGSGAVSAQGGKLATDALAASQARVSTFASWDVRPGCIGWALAQPDGAVVSLYGENVSAVADAGRSISLREPFESGPLVSRLMLQLPSPTTLAAWNQIDIVSGTLSTLPSGQRLITNPTAVYRWTDADGSAMIRAPKKFDETGPVAWQWRELVYSQ